MTYTESDFDDLDILFEEFGLKIEGYQEGVAKPFKTSQGPYALQTLVNKLQKIAGKLQEGDEPKRVWNAFDKKNMKQIVAILSGYVDARTLRQVEEESEEAQKYQGHILAVDGSNGSDKEPSFFLIDPDFKKSNMLAAKYIALMGIESPVAVAREITPMYLPRSPLGITKMRDPEDEEKQIEALNTYIPPSWHRYKDDDSVPAELPEEIKLMIDHIFPDEMDRIYFWHWNYMALTSRTAQFMVLCGEPGNGKNRIKIMIRALHGHKNSEDGKEKMFSSQFNTKLKNNTFIFCDEISYSRGDVSRMKEIPNGSVSIEGKHKDATRATQIFCNVVLANNYQSDNWLDFIDRKFFSPTMAEDRLDVAIGKDVVDIITRKMENIDHPDFDEKYIAQTGKWILENGHRPDLFPMNEFRGSQFFKIAHVSMSEWQRSLIVMLSEIMAGGPEVAKDMRDVNLHKGNLKKGQLKMSTVKNLLLKSKTLKLPGSKFPRLQVCIEFLKKYRTEDGEQVYEVKGTGDTITGDFFIRDIRMGGQMEEIVTPDEVADL